MPNAAVIVAALARRESFVLLVEQQGPEDDAPAWMLPGGPDCVPLARNLAGDALPGAVYVVEP